MSGDEDTGPTGAGATAPPTPANDPISDLKPLSSSSTTTSSPAVPPTMGGVEFSGCIWTGEKPNVQWTSRDSSAERRAAAGHAIAPRSVPKVVASLGAISGPKVIPANNRKHDRGNRELLVDKLKKEASRPW